MKKVQACSWVRKARIAERLSECLRDESSTEKLALTLAVGLVLGVFPIFGLPTILCGIAAAVWRLNFPALQLVNYLAYPLQIALLWPLSRLGGILLGHSLHLRGPAHFSLIAMRMAAAWSCLSIPAAVLLYLALHRLLRWQRARMSSASA